MGSKKKKPKRYHNELSFGATPYLIKATFRGKICWILCDTPKFTKASIDAVTSLTGPNGPDYLFLTHVDDTAHHNLWVDKFPNLKRIMNSRELDNNWIGDKTLEDVEISLDDTKSWIHNLDGIPVSALPNNSILGDSNDITNSLTKQSRNDLLYNDEQNDDDDVLLLHTPGHSPGSTTLYRLPKKSNNNHGILFTGDTYGFTTLNGGHMTGFPNYGDNLKVQAQSLNKLKKIRWDTIAPGHGHPRDYRNLGSNMKKNEEIQIAIDELRGRS